MKTICLSFLLIIWFIFTLILVISIIGLMLIAFEPGWMRIGIDIKNKLTE